MSWDVTLYYRDFLSDLLQCEYSLSQKVGDSGISNSPTENMNSVKI